MQFLFIAGPHHFDGNLHNHLLSCQWVYGILNLQSKAARCPLGHGAMQWPTCACYLTIPIRNNLQNGKYFSLSNLSNY